MEKEEMKQRESGVLRHKWWSEGYILSMVVIQDSRVYMLCKVAQVFMLEEVGLFFCSHHLSLGRKANISL